MRNILCGLLALASLTLSAQTVTTSLSGEFELRDIPIRKAGNNFYQLEMSRPKGQLAFSINMRKALHGLTLVKYDGNMKELKREEVAEGKKEFGFFMSKLISFNDQLLLFYYRIQDNDDMLLFMARIDTGTLAVTYNEELRRLYKSELDYNRSLFGAVVSNQGDLYTEPSPDKSKLLVVSAPPKSLFSCIVGKEEGLRLKPSPTYPVSRASAPLRLL